MIAINICEQRGLKVPQDVAIVGFDNIETAAWGRPSLTTVAVDKHKLGHQAVSLLLSDAYEEKNQLLPVKLIVRESSCKEH